MPKIQNEAVVARFIAASRAQRSVLAIIFNSNGRKDAYGIQGALTKRAFARLAIPIYCSGLHTMCGVNSSTGAQIGSDPFSSTLGLGWRSNAIGTGAGDYAAAASLGALSEVPTLRDKYVWGRAPLIAEGNNADGSYHAIHSPLWYKGPNIAGGQTAGMRMETAASPADGLNKSGNLRGSFWYSPTAPVGAGGATFRPGVENGVTRAVLAQASALITITETATPSTMSRAFVDLAAANRETLEIRWGWHMLNGTALTVNGGSPGAKGIFLGYHDILDRDKLFGWRVEPFFGFGGQGLWDWAHTFVNDIPDGTIDHFIDATIQPQLDAGQNPCMAWWMNDGLNSRNDTGGGQGAVVRGLPAGPISDTAAGYAANMKEMVARLLERWTRKGFEGERLWVINHADHTRQDPEDAKLVSYRTTAHDTVAAIFPRNYATIVSHEIVSSATMMRGAGVAAVPSVNSWYAASGSDVEHLAMPGVGASVVNGYNAYTDLVLDAMDQARVPSASSGLSRRGRLQRLT